MSFTLIIAASSYAIGASLMSMAMRQVLLPHVGGDPYSGRTISLVNSSIVASPYAHTCMHATHFCNSHQLSHLTYVQEMKTTY
jgi:hypothetical protein